MLFSGLDPASFDLFQTFADTSAGIVAKVSHCGQAGSSVSEYDYWVAVEGDQGLIVRTQYLHLSAFTCVECNGPVISGSTATRETEIQRETNIRQVGMVCLACGKKYTSNIMTLRRSYKK